MNSLCITRTSVRDLVPYENNPRGHSAKQIEQVAKSIQEFGFINPIVIDAKNKVIAGHGRLLAAKKLGLKDVPVTQVIHLSEAQVRAYRIADNKLCENSVWDEASLKLELEYLSEIEIDLDLTGFETTEIDLILLDDEETEAQDKSLANLVLPQDTAIVPGDIFTLGEHRIICGDCRDADVMSALMAGKQADMICSDPPFNVKVNGHVLTKDDAHAEFAMASGEMSPEEFTDFLANSFSSFATHSRDGSLHYLFMDWRHMSEILSAGNKVYDDFVNLCVWTKTNAGMGSLYRSQHELVFVFKKGNKPHRNNVQLGKHGRYRSNVWSYAGMNSFGSERDELLASHPTIKPVKMIADAILDVTKRGDVVLDGFLGSGTAVLAAEQTGRTGYGCELSPQYVEVAIKRFRAISNKPVIHEQTDLPFAELIHSRLDKKGME